MQKRYVSIWFRHLTTDWFTVRQPKLKDLPFVLRTSSRGRMIITAANAAAEAKGILLNTVLADARAILPELQVADDQPDLVEKLLTRIAEWCIRFTPAVAVDAPDGILMDVTGCSHLWGGDTLYTVEIAKRLRARGYDVRVAIADTIGTAWAIARYGKEALVIKSGHHIDALMSLPPQALRLEAQTIDRLHKLGLHHIRQFIRMPRPALRRRFGPHLIMRLDMALGQQIEVLHTVHPVEPYHERLPCMEPIVTAIGIAIALQQLLESLCLRLQREKMGLRTAVLKCYRVDSKIEEVSIGTNRPSHHVMHLFKLFENKLPSIEPALGIELFVLEAPKVEEAPAQQEQMWQASGGLEDIRLSELIDRLANKIGMNSIHRYLPDEHYWPERSVKSATSLQEEPTTTWRAHKQRPLQILPAPVRIEVSAPIPDYPPMLFRYREKVHKIIKADGPERIEQEWWLQQGQHRDYYRVEDEDGNRYWLFRLGHYDEKVYQWFLHGFFA